MNNKIDINIERSKWLAWYSESYTEYVPTDERGIPLNLDSLLSLKTWLAAKRDRASQAPTLTVWYGSMPESNGKSNFTAILNRKDAKGLDKFDGFTIALSEYPDRVRYEADCVRHLIGELAEKPCILDYDADKHSGYVQPKAQEASQAPAIDERAAFDRYMNSIDLAKDELSKAYFWPIWKARAALVVQTTHNPLVSHSDERLVRSKS